MSTAMLPSHSVASPLRVTLLLWSRFPSQPLSRPLTTPTHLQPAGQPRIHLLCSYANEAGHLRHDSVVSLVLPAGGRAAGLTDNWQC